MRTIYLLTRTNKTCPFPELAISKIAFNSRYTAEGYRDATAPEFVNGILSDFQFSIEEITFMDSHDCKNTF